MLRHAHGATSSPRKEQILSWWRKYFGCIVLGYKINMFFVLYLKKWFPYHSRWVAFTKANGTVYLDATSKLWISFPKFEWYHIQLCYVVFSVTNGTKLWVSHPNFGYRIESYGKDNCIAILHCIMGLRLQSPFYSYMCRDRRDGSNISYRLILTEKAIQSLIKVCDWSETIQRDREHWFYMQASWHHVVQ